GTGLGLAMVYGIVQRHAGVFDIASSPGHGTTMAIRFPLSSQAPREKESRQVPGGIRPLQVLVVDDDRKVSEVTADFVRLEGHSPEIASDGTIALERFRSRHFDLIITDQAMRGMTGDQLARAIKDISPETPVIMLTGFGAL